MASLGIKEAFLDLIGEAIEEIKRTENLDPKMKESILQRLQEVHDRSTVIAIYLLIPTPRMRDEFRQLETDLCELLKEEFKQLSRTDPCKLKTARELARVLHELSQLELA